MRAQRVLHGDRRLEVERHRLEIAGQGLLFQRVEVLAGHLQDRPGGLERDPSFDRRTPHVLVGRDEVEFLAQVALHDLERVTGGAFLVHDQDAGGAAPRALLELVGPAAVIRHRLAVEDLVVELRGIGGVGHLRVVHEHDDGLALDVDALEVVPVELGRGHAVAGEDHLGVADRRAVGDVLGPGDDLVLPLEGLRGPGAGDGQRPRVGPGDADERHLLHERAVGVSRLEPELLELLLEVLDGELFALRSRRAPFELVGRHRLDAIQDRRRIELRHRGDGRAFRRRAGGRRGGVAAAGGASDFEHAAARNRRAETVSSRFMVFPTATSSPQGRRLPCACRARDPCREATPDRRRPSSAW